jgi:P2-related tail formation protein
VSCIKYDILFTTFNLTFLSNHVDNIIKTNHNTIHIKGAKNIKIIVFVHPEAITTQVHHFATALHRYHHIRA